MLARMGLGVLDRARMEIVADELRVRKAFAIITVDHAMAAADIGDLGALLQFCNDAVERREPVADQIVVVARPEKPRHRAKQAAA